MDTILSDFRYAVRGLLKSPSVSIIAVAALALGIGLTTVMFSIVYGALYRGLPFDGAEAIMHGERANPTEGIQSMEVTIHDYRDWRERQRSFTHLAAFYESTVNIRGTERPERYDGGFMTANSFDILGVRPILDRSFREEEEQPGSPHVALLGYRVWQERYGGTPDVLGQSVTITGEPGQIIGLMPEGFEFPLLQEVWVPLRVDHVALPRGDGQSLEVFGDLKDGVTVDQAMIEFSGITAQLGAEFPETNEGVTAMMQPYTEEFIGDDERRILLSMLFTVVLVLIIARANVANLLLARASARSRDLAIQTAMGASRWRVVSQMLAEAAILTLVGAAVGTGVAWIGISRFGRRGSVVPERYNPYLRATPTITYADDPTHELHSARTTWIAVNSFPRWQPPRLSPTALSQTSLPALPASFMRSSSAQSRTLASLKWDATQTDAIGAGSCCSRGMDALSRLSRWSSRRRSASIWLTRRRISLVRSISSANRRFGDGRRNGVPSTAFS